MKKQTVAFSVMPAVPWGTEERCITLEAGFARQLLGLCGVLTLYRMWDGTDEEIAVVQAQVEKGIAALMGCGCTEGIESVSRSKSGYLVSIDSEGNRTLLQSFYDNDDIAAMPEEQDAGNNDANICAGVRFMVDRLIDDVLFSLDQAQLAIDGYLTIAETISGLLKLSTLGTSTPFDLVDAFGEWTAEVATLSVATLKLAFSDPAVRHKLEENLYCGITQIGEGALTLEIYDSAVNDLPLLESQSSILATFMRGFEIVSPITTFDKILRFYNIGALNEDSTCAAEFDCPFLDGCSDFGADEAEVVWTVPFGTGTGGQRCAAAGNRLKIVATLPEDRKITSLEFKLQKTGGTTLSVVDAWLEKDGSIVRDLITYSHNDGAYTWYQWPGINTANTVADTVIIDITSANTCIKDVKICFEA